MTKTYLTINGDELIPLSTVKRLRHVSEADRQSLSKLSEKIDGERYNTRLDLAGSKKRYASETVDDIVRQGVSLVQIATDAFVPCDNIQKVRRISDQDRVSYSKNTGREMSADFRSQIETKAGKILATIPAEAVMACMDDPYRPVKVTNQGSIDTGSEPDATLEA